MNSSDWHSFVIFQHVPGKIKCAMFIWWNGNIYLKSRKQSVILLILNDFLIKCGFASFYSIFGKTCAPILFMQPDFILSFFFLHLLWSCVSRRLCALEYDRRKENFYRYCIFLHTLFLYTEKWFSYTHYALFIYLINILIYNPWKDS